MDGQYALGNIVLGSWKLVRLIGEGSYGRVFEAEREDFGVIYKAAIKIVTIPQSQSEVANARTEGMDDVSVTAYFRSFVEEIVQEFVLMSKLKGHSNVVSYEDHTVVPHQNGVGWDIIIRMELLSPLLDYIQQHRMTRRDVIKLGIDICRALELCQKYNIVHRDIKPENIFISELGDFKLGDFGIARTVEKTTGGLSKKGTYTYMAPEVYKEEPYHSNVDIYSLGIVLYRLLNENRAPFLPPFPAVITYRDRESALYKRLSGEPIPVPKNADGRLAEIVLKACAYLPKERYSSPIQMRQELEAILYDRPEAPIIYPNGDEVPINSVREGANVATTPTKSGQFVADERTESVFHTASFRSDAREGDKRKPTIELEDKTESVFSSGNRQIQLEKQTDKRRNPIIPIITISMIAILMAAFYGLRRSEIMGLRWQAIDFENNQMTVDHTVVQCICDGESKIIEKDRTKNKSSCRSMPLVPQYRELLLRMKERQENCRKLCGNSYTDTEYIFVNDMGVPYKPNYVTQHFKIILRKNQLRDIRFHDLRHTCASLLLKNGVAMKDIQDWLGHSDYATTANIYAHLDTTSKSTSAVRMTGVLSIDPGIQARV